MADYKNIFINYLTREGIKHTDVDEFVVSIGYRCENISVVKMYIYFDREGEGLVHLASDVIEHFGGDSAAKGMIVCNTMNNRFRWAKFELDKDQDLVVEHDAIVTPETVGPIVMSLIRRIVGIIDEAFPEIEKTKWT